MQIANVAQAIEIKAVGCDRLFGNKIVFSNEGCWVEQPKLQAHALPVELLSHAVLKALDWTAEPGYYDLSRIHVTPAHCREAMINTVFATAPLKNSAI